MFAYVKFAGFGANSCMKVVAIEDIKVKGSNVKNIDQNKLYKVKHPVTGKYSNAQVILVNESLEELSKIIQTKRPVVKPIKNLESPSDSFSSSAEETPAKSKNLGAITDTNLHKRLQILRDEHAKREMETTLRLNYEVASTPITSPVKNSRRLEDITLEHSKENLTKKQKLTEIHEYNTNMKSLEAEVSAYKNEIEYLKNELQSVKNDLNAKQIMWTEEKTALSKEILQKEAKMEELINELREIRNLNKELQRSAIQHFGQIKATLQEFKAAGTVDMLNSKEIVVGYIDADTEKIYLGHNVWISTESYALVIGTATTPSMFVAEMMLVLFPYETLLNSTLSGKPSNRTKMDAQKTYKKLDPVKVMAIKAIFRYWLLTERRMSETETDEEMDKAKEYMRRKLSSIKETRQLKTKKKLSQLYVNEQNKQLQEVNAIIENDADFLPNDSSTDPLQSLIETTDLMNKEDNVSLLANIGNCTPGSLENVNMDDGENNCDNDSENHSDKDSENNCENCEEYREEILFLELPDNSPN